MDITMPLRVRELDASGEQAYDERGNPIVAGFSLPVLRSQLSLRDEDFAVPIVSIDRSLGHTPKRADSELDPTVFKPVPEFEGSSGPGRGAGRRDRSSTSRASGGQADASHAAEEARLATGRIMKT